MLCSDSYSVALQFFLVYDASQCEIRHALHPKEAPFGSDVVEGGTHGVGFHKGKGAYGCRKEAMKHSPRSWHQLQWPGDAGEEEQSDGEEGNEQQGGIAVLEERRARKAEEGGGKEIGCQQLDKE